MIVDTFIRGIITISKKAREVLLHSIIVVQLGSAYAGRADIIAIAVFTITMFYGEGILASPTTRIVFILYLN